MQYYPFDSRNTLYRNHIGAVASGESLKLRLLLHKDSRCYDAFLRIKRDGNDCFDEVHLKQNGILCDYLFYECEIALDTALYWYDFRYTSAYGTKYVSKTDTSLGIVTEESGNCWQLTVYDNNFTTPEWLAGGIIYQIFPDRFYNSGTAKENVPGDRFLCSDWRRQPQYRQDGDADNLGNDYFGGDLEGIRRKLGYLKELGVTCIYLNPIFEAHSNHRYNTADYMKIDSLLGDENDLRNLCRDAKKNGISIILDGVFSHTGDDSIYFNRGRRYGNGGAFNRYDSKFHSWYKFLHFPDDYHSWWGISTLPETNEDDDSFSSFITGENGVLRHWLRYGISGWRLDVADELPDDFLYKVRSAIKEENPNAYLLGEVWEDASNKISYGSRRKFLLGGQLDSVMNYPFANGIVDFLRGGDAKTLSELVLSITENYPPCATAVLMNHIGTHDTMRIITNLAKGDEYIGDREWQSRHILNAEEYKNAVSMLKIAAVIQFTLPGVPSIYYGDEAGLQGYGDPFCRATYPWGSENIELVEFYRSLGKTRRECKAFKFGFFTSIYAEGRAFAFMREGDGESAFIAVNAGDKDTEFTLPEDFTDKFSVFGKRPQGGIVRLSKYEYTVITH